MWQAMAFFPGLSKADWVDLTAIELIEMRRVMQEIGNARNAKAKKRRSKG